MAARFEKPSHVFGRDREWDALADFTADQRQEATLGIVSGRRRQGKTYLLRSLAGVADGFFYEAVEATEAESLRMFGAALARYSSSAADFSFSSWEDALRYFLALADRRPVPLIIDEFPYLVKASPALPSLLRREIDSRGPSQDSGSRARVLLCGSAMSVMGGLLTGSAPLRGRAGLEMVIKPFAFRDAARFWGVTDPGLAVQLHAVVGGTPAYRRQFVRDDAPVGAADFDHWVVRSVLNPDRPLLREVRYLLAEETDIRDPAIYYSVLAAIAARNETWGGIANYIGRKTADIAHPLNVLEDAGLVAKEIDVFRSGRARYRITEPLITFYEAIMRPRWADLELGLGAEVWADASPRFGSQVVGPHFEAMCRDFARADGRQFFGTPVGEVGSGTVADPANKTQIEVDVAVLGQTRADEPRQVISLGEAKWGKVMGIRHIERLRRARALLTVKGYDTAGTKLVCYSGAGFDSDLLAAASSDILLVDLNRLYEPALGQLPVGEAVQEVDQAGEVHLLVVVHGHVAAVRAVQVLPAGQPPGHHLHVGRVHGVVTGADDQGRHVDRGQFGGPVPVGQARVGADAKLAGTLHGDVDRRVDMGEGTHRRIGPLRDRHPQHVMDVVLLVEQVDVPRVLGVPGRSSGWSLNPEPSWS
jgi:AAA+ ATPase superfamily predicted ATPase